MRAVFFFLASLLVSRSMSAASDPLAVAAEMRRLELQIDRVQIDPLLRTLPSEWDISIPDGSYRISTGPLRDLLGIQEQNHREDNLQQARAWLDHLAAHLERSSIVPRATADADGKLARIMAMREFAGVGPPTQWELLQERMRTWILNLFAHLFGFVEQHSIESEIFFWILIASTVTALGVWLLRRWSRAGPVFLNIPDVDPARTSNQWMAAVRAASEQGDLRRAIQCAYWAAIVRLEETGMLARSRPHTPREYLGLLSSPRAGPSSPFARPLAVLTNHLERFWYAGGAATAEDLSACLAALEACGCRAD
jgi:Domain of unknown function (DUF4129)